MSMIGNLARVTEDARVALHRDPQQIVAYLYGNAASKKAAKSNLLARLFGSKREEPKPESDSAPLVPESDRMDIEKAWHELHFLFTGSDWEGDFPNGFLVSCGAPIGDVDVG